MASATLLLMVVYGIIPIAGDAEAFEFFFLNLNPVRGELAALLAELKNGDVVFVLPLLAVALLDLPFDGQPVAIPAWDIVGVEAHHLLGAHDDVLEDLIQGVADVEVAVGVGRAVVEDELLAPLGGSHAGGYRGPSWPSDRA